MSYNIGQAVKLVATDFSSGWGGGSTNNFVIYDTEDNVLTLESKDYLILLSASAFYTDSGASPEGTVALFVFDAPLITQAHLIMAFGNGNNHWSCSGEGLFCPTGKVPAASPGNSTAGSGVGIVIEARLVRDPLKRTGYPNPILQRT